MPLVPLLSCCKDSRDSIFIREDAFTLHFIPMNYKVGNPLIRLANWLEYFSDPKSPPSLLESLITATNKLVLHSWSFIVSRPTQVSCTFISDFSKDIFSIRCFPMQLSSIKSLMSQWNTSEREQMICSQRGTSCCSFSGLFVRLSLYISRIVT